MFPTLAAARRSPARALWVYSLSRWVFIVCLSSAVQALMYEAIRCTGVVKRDPML